MTVAYHRRPVLWDIDLQIAEGKLVGIVGPNGAGKTTLIKAALGLVPLASGKVEIYGKSYDEQRQLVGYVPQRESVDWDFPVRVRDVVLMGTYGRLGWFRRPGKAEREIADRCLEQVGMAAMTKANGMILCVLGVATALKLWNVRQIVATTAAFAAGFVVPVLLGWYLHFNLGLRFATDDHYDMSPAAAAIVELLHALRSNGKTVLVVHHDLQTVRDYFDHVILLNMRLVACGPIEKTFTNENLQKTYGGRLTILDEAAEAMRQREPNR